MRLTTCTPGEATIKAKVYELKKGSTDVSKIAEVVAAQPEEGKGVYHVRAPCLVTAKGADRVIVTDGAIYAALETAAQSPALPEAKYRLTGYLMPAADGGLEFWPDGVIRRTKIATVPVITISGPGTISYTLDGKTYVEYKEPIVITNEGQTDLQGTISAFAQEAGKRPGAIKEESYRVSGIGSLSADGAAGVSGRRVGQIGLRRGIYIVRLPDGRAVKVSVR